MSKVYEVRELSRLNAGWYGIEDDSGFDDYVPVSKFMTIEDYRKSIK